MTTDRDDQAPPAVGFPLDLRVGRPVPEPAVFLGVGSPAVWVQQHRGGYGYRTRNLARVLRRARGGRVVVRCYSWWTHAWVEKTVIPANVLQATASEAERLEKMEREYPPPNVGAKRAATAQPLSVRLSDQFGHTEKD